MPAFATSVTKLYLDGCSALAEFAGAYVYDSIPAFIEVTRSAPRFEGGWAKLILAEAQVSANEEPGGPTVIPALREHMISARKLDPNMAELAYAEIELFPKDNFGPPLELRRKRPPAIQSIPSCSGNMRACCCVSAE